MILKTKICFLSQMKANELTLKHFNVPVLSDVRLWYRLLPSFLNSLSKPTLTAIDVVSSHEVVEEEGVNNGGVHYPQLHAAALVAGVVIKEQASADINARFLDLCQIIGGPQGVATRR